MSAKNRDEHGRFRNITVGFRVSPEENEQINVAVALSGLPKQEYCYRKCLNRDIVVQGNPRVYKALRNQLAAVLDELKRIEAAGELGENAAEVIHDCALQVAAASPVAPEYVRREEVRADHLEHEKEILVAQARNEGKPEKIIEKMVEGRIKKFYQDVCLLEQAFVKDGDISVQTMINQKAKGLEIVRFTRYKMGDGLEKKVNDLAAEVAEQTAKMGL